MNVDDSKKAFDALKDGLEGTQARVDWADLNKTSTLFVGNIEPDMVEDIHEAVRRLKGVQGELQRMYLIKSNPHSLPLSGLKHRGKTDSILHSAL